MTTWAWYDGAWHVLGRLVPAARAGDQRLAFACGVPVVTGNAGWRVMDCPGGHVPRGPLCGRCHVPTGAMIGGRLDFEVVR